MIKLVSADITVANGASVESNDEYSPPLTSVLISNAKVLAPAGSVVISGGYDLSAGSFSDAPLPIITTNGPINGTSSWVVSSANAYATSGITWPPPADHVFGTVYAIVEVFEIY